MKTTKFVPAEYLTSPEAQAELVSEAFESGDPKFIAHALGTVARARGMTGVSRESGVSREALYRALSEEGDPRLSTLTSVLSALGFGLEAKVLEGPAG
ncbi:MAG: putative addiction module antidote protein [Boseongicola sp. SB0677_bin_26]|nr:putative addiction module antidote protein [Boseongicola sp. SB0665_bin_10]MYG24719.1 putative addiction module antidote protein [Boseongicola sp. SB0677_bin_26]